jgi:ketosteroid isomerase-like protein
MSPVKEEKAATAAVIRQRVEDCAKALRARDIDGVMSLYASNLVSFDVGPPLRYSGTDNKNGGQRVSAESMTSG